MTTAYLIAAVGFIALGLYCYASAAVIREARLPERLARISVALLLFVLPVGWIDIAASQDSLLWRQWMTGAALVGIAAGYAGLLWGRRRSGR